MMREHRMRRGGLRVAAGLLGMAGLAVGFALPAGAASAPAQNHIIIGAGSNTTYLMMNQMDVLFNQSPGCDLAAPSGQQDDYFCGGNSDAGENGLSNNTAELSAWTSVSPLSAESTCAGGDTCSIVTVDSSGENIDVAGTGSFTTFSAPATQAPWSPGGTVLLWPATSGVSGDVNNPDVPIVCAGTSTDNDNGLGTQAEFTDCTSSTSQTLTAGEPISSQFVGGDGENPLNDVAMQEPPLGSSNGIAELATTGTNYAPANYARSSRGPKNGETTPTGIAVSGGTGDPAGLNFVAYAQDAVPWMHWTVAPHLGKGPCGTGSPAVACIDTPSYHIISLSIPVLTSIYNGVITNWNQICDGSAASKSANPTTCGHGTTAQQAAAVNNTGGGYGTAGVIYPYIAQNGSGTEGTWVAALGLTFPGTAITNLNTATPGYAQKHEIFENEISQVLTNEDEANAIFFFSYGKFTTGCTASPAVCGSATTGSGSKMALGEEADTTNGVPITVSSTTINNKHFPTDRFLYNVYGDGNGVTPVATSATLNYVGPNGFICRQDTTKDSNSGTTYGIEIRKVITNAGFFSLPPTSSMYVQQGSLPAPTPESVTDPAYQFVNPGQGTTTGTGRCLVFTTDGDGH